ncbi:hypothetical protein BD410DRAFT_797449 [Rickenella mellea]|uniref:Uncharacterized protein n=1 Tax=Rickenella mellea TaxID=50990 RepID=A0A4Y7PHJ5_9AGAM|nr:hypothetical protein BD410DRAFT_797449 [Rickenella mellea]
MGFELSIDRDRHRLTLLSRSRTIRTTLACRLSCICGHSLPCICIYALEFLKRKKAEAQDRIPGFTCGRNISETLSNYQAACRHGHWYYPS